MKRSGVHEESFSIIFFDFGKYFNQKSAFQVHFLAFLLVFILLDASKNSRKKYMKFSK